LPRFENSTELLRSDYQIYRLTELKAIACALVDIARHLLRSYYTFPLRILIRSQIW
jgi:hypothetical protein